MENIHEIYENAMNDPSLLSTIDIDALLEKIDCDDNNYLENKTLAEVSKDIFDAISDLEIDSKLARQFCDRLVGYRYVERICDLRNGKMMRWIKRPFAPFRIFDAERNRYNPFISAPEGGILNENWCKNAEINQKSLTNGGILMNIKIENSGVQLLCRNNANRFFNIKFDDCLVFQKLSMEEQLILMSYEYIDNSEI